jgi:galacturan 1,4-alpha-galacturonidase
VTHILVKDWQFHGGDDCLAPKGNTMNLIITNRTCAGGGIAFSSVGQYVESPDYVFSVAATNVFGLAGYQSANRRSLRVRWSMF